MLRPHTILSCHRVTGSCHFCEPSPFAVIQRREPDELAEFADSESDIAVNYIHIVKRPRYALHNKYM